MFSVLTAPDVQELRERRRVANEATECASGVTLLGKAEDITAIQKLIDDEYFGVDQTYELQCLGVAFGDVLAFDGRFRWVIVDDDYGRDPTLRWKDTSFNVNALTIISKRVERGERAELDMIMNWAFERAGEVERRELS